MERIECRTAKRRGYRRSSSTNAASTPMLIDGSRPALRQAAQWTNIATATAGLEVVVSSDVLPIWLRSLQLAPDCLLYCGRERHPPNDPLGMLISNGMRQSSPLFEHPGIETAGPCFRCFAGTHSHFSGIRQSEGTSQRADAINQLCRADHRTRTALNEPDQSSNMAPTGTDFPAL